MNKSKIIRILLVVFFIVILLPNACSGDYYSSPKDAFEQERGYDSLQGAWAYVSEEIGVYKVNDTYFVYLAVLDYKRNNEKVDTVISVIPMKTKKDKYSWTGDYHDFSTDILKCTSESEETMACANFAIENAEIEVWFSKKELFKKDSLSEDYVFYNGTVSFEDQKNELTIAIACNSSKNG